MDIFASGLICNNDGVRMEKTEKKPLYGTAVFRRFRHVPRPDEVLEMFDYGLIAAIKLRRPKRPR